MAMSGIFVVAFIVVPSVAFAFAEPEWNFIDAVYFVFISLTTIGLGDYIPGAIQRPICNNAIILSNEFQQVTTTKTRRGSASTKLSWRVRENRIRIQLSSPNLTAMPFSVYLLLGLIFMTLTATVYYDIPQLNLGLVR